MLFQHFDSPLNHLPPGPFSHRKGIPLLSASGVVSTHLLLTKSKVVPLERVTLPGLEPCAALLLARCLHTVTEA
ncbi:hypothetical protein PR048_024145 [Dryococelus australis]|uniref:Uncharacterized protein n=1 Tax=Dryococelus australis TaxID=614101 RepID=A0ABQ9GW30_9NEOP|nr:hypothetical protein PR048_024145 [Dryococelus australis]